MFTLFALFIKIILPLISCALSLMLIYYVTQAICIVVPWVSSTIFYGYINWKHGKQEK